MGVQHIEGSLLALRNKFLREVMMTDDGDVCGRFLARATRLMIEHGREE